jgi:uncharacterized protein (TIGR00290 family)
MKKTYFNWSTGKDSAIALHKLLQDPHYSVEKLLTSVNAHYDRVSMHGLRRSLMEQQVEAIGIPHTTIELPQEPTMDEYESKMKTVIAELKSEQFTTAAFGDIFLEDLKAYREKQLATVGIDTVFPIWKRETKELLHEFLDLGFKTIVVCTKSELLDESFAGRIIDHDFIKDLPSNVDPCGENGEFHTFCFDGPIFKKPISFELGEKTYREYENPSKDEAHSNDKSMGFWFCDLI